MDTVTQVGLDRAFVIAWYGSCDNEPCQDFELVNIKDTTGADALQLVSIIAEVDESHKTWKTFTPGNLAGNEVTHFKCGHAYLIFLEPWDENGTPGNIQVPGLAVVDSAMNDLIRPTLYEAWHDIDPVAQPADDAEIAPVDIVGPVCETGDVLAVQRDMPPLAPDDLLAVRSAGAYGAVMSSTYNSRLLIPETMVNGAQFAVIRPRHDYDTLIGQDVVPGWIAGG